MRVHNLSDAALLEHIGKVTRRREELVLDRPTGEGTFDRYMELHGDTLTELHTEARRRALLG